jgi:hypothetical protein
MVTQVRVTLFRKKRELYFCLPLHLPKDIEQKNFTVVIPAEHNMDSGIWSNLFETLKSGGALGTPTARRLRTSTDDETNNGVVTKIVVSP